MYMFVSFKVDGETKSVSKYVRVDNITKPGITLENGKDNVEMYNYEFSKAYVFCLIDAASVNTNNWTQVKDAAAMEQNNPYASTTKNGFMTYQQSSKKNHKDAIYLPNVAGTYVVFVSYIDEDGAIVQVSEVFALEKCVNA